MICTRVAMLIFALGIAMPGLAAAQSEIRIGFIDSEAIIREAPGYQEANDAFNRTAESWRDSLEQKRARLQELFDEYKKQEVILSPEKKTEKQEEMLRMEEEVQAYFQTKFGPEGEANTRQAELLQPIIEQVNTVIDQTRQDGGYSLIFDLQDGALVAGDPSLNITDEVIQRLQQMSPASQSR